MTQKAIQLTDTQLSKFLSFVLRHRPDSIGLTLSPEGWMGVDELIQESCRSGNYFTKEELLDVVATSEKKRFILSGDGRRIRAAQGHSVQVDLGLASKKPPHCLYHGTAERFLKDILREGLKPQERNHVHLSTGKEAAQRVGQRHGRPIILKIQSDRMYAEGFTFFVAENGVWLTAQVLPEFLQTTSFVSEADSATTSRQPKLSR